MGSAGGSQGSGSRVHPGKNMPGRMGGQRVTVKSLKVLHVSDEEGIVVVNGGSAFCYQLTSLSLISSLQGCVPGPKRGLVMIQDALKKPWPDVPLSVPGAEFEHGLTVS